VQITYMTTLEDYVAFNRHVARKSAVLWAIFLLGWLVLPIIAAIALPVLIILSDLWSIAVIVGLFGLLYAAIYPPVYRWWYDEIMRAHARGLGTRGVIGRITLVLTEQSLVEITETTRSEVRWQDVNGVEVAGDYTFIFVTGLSAAILPRYGFECDEDYEGVKEFALAKVGHAGLGDNAGQTRQQDIQDIRVGTRQPDVQDIRVERCAAPNRPRD
jgi:hypothetical protein